MEGMTTCETTGGFRAEQSTSVAAVLLQGSLSLAPLLRLECIGPYEPEGEHMKSIRAVFVMVCVTKKCNYARHLSTVTTLRFCTCINSHASGSFI